MKAAAAVAVSVALMSSGFALAQETTGAIIGTVTSEDGVGLPGVTLTIRNPDKGLERSTVSSADGSYKFVAVPPARYALQANLDGFRSYRRAIDVDLGRTVKNDLTMALGAVTQTIEVTGEAPQVDVISTVSGMTVNTDELNDRVPIGREATQIALLAPTSVNSDTAFNGSYGYTPGQNVASIGGASAAENLYMVNGLNITNFRNFVGSTFVPFEFLEEVQVKTGGYEAEFGRSVGGVINMVTKSGTNTLRGSASVYYRPERLNEQEPDAWQRQNQDEFAESLETNASVGGAFSRDKLFFFAFIRYEDTQYSEIWSTRETVNENAAPYYGAKLDWNITPSHRLEGTYLVDQTDFDRNLYSWNAEERAREGLQSTVVNHRGGTNWIVSYIGVLSDDLLLSGQYGVNEFDRSDPPPVSPAGETCYAADDWRSTWTPIGCWVNWLINDGGDERTASRLDLDWYLGKHSLRCGVDYEDLTSTADTTYAGGLYYTYLSNYEFPEIPDGADVVRVSYFQGLGSFKTTTAGIYLQDSWAVWPAFTLNIGVRWEQYENFNSEGEAFIKIDDQYAPRLGFIWDPLRQGRQKIYGSFGQYHIPIASNTNIRLAGLETRILRYYEVIDQHLAGGSPYFDNGEPTGVGLLLETIELSSGEVPDTDTLVASNLDPMSQLEYILGYERMVGTDWSVGARFIHRRFEQVIEDFTIDQALYEEYGLCEGGCAQFVLGNPGSSFEGFYDLDGDGFNDPIEFSAEELAYPKAIRDYYAVELTANKRFSNNWLLQASYVWSQVYGNYEGYLNSDLGQDDAGLTQDFDLPGYMDNKYGFLPNDRRHNLKVYGAYAWDMGLQVGGFLNWRTGRPMNAMAVHPHDSWASLYGVGSFFEQVTPGPEGSIPSPRGSQGTTDDVFFLDGTVKYDFQTGAVNWYLRMDVFNLFNQQSNIQVNEASGTDSFGVDEGFLEVTHWQPPRTVRLGFGLSF